MDAYSRGGALRIFPVLGFCDATGTSNRVLFKNIGFFANCLLRKCLGAWKMSGLTDYPMPDYPEYTVVYTQSRRSLATRCTKGTKLVRSHLGGGEARGVVVGRKDVTY